MGRYTFTAYVYIPYLPRQCQAAWYKSCFAGHIAGNEHAWCRVSFSESGSYWSANRSGVRPRSMRSTLAKGAVGWPCLI